MDRQADNWRFKSTQLSFGVATIPSIGYFINDNVELSGAFHWEDGEIDDVDYDALGFSILGLYHFNQMGANKNIVPFVNASLVGMTHTDTALSSVLILGPPA